MVISYAHGELLSSSARDRSWWNSPVAVVARYAMRRSSSAEFAGWAEMSRRTGRSRDSGATSFQRLGALLPDGVPARDWHPWRGECAQVLERPGRQVRPGLRSVLRTHLGMPLRGRERQLQLAPPVCDFCFEGEIVQHAGHLVVLCRGLPSLVVPRRGTPLWYAA